MTERGAEGDGGKPGGHTVLWLIVCPTTLIVLLVSFLSGMAEDAAGVVPWALAGAGAGAALILYLRGNDRPGPQAVAAGRWGWALAVIPAAVVASGVPTSRPSSSALYPGSSRSS